MRRTILTIAAVLTLSSCMDEGPIGPEPGNGDAQLAVLNALGVGDDVELRLDGTLLTMPQWGSTMSAAIAPGSHRLEVRAPGNNELLASAEFAVPASGRRSAVIGGATANNVALLVVSDTASLPPAGAAKVRLVHTVTKAPIYDSYLGLAGQPTDSSSLFVNPFTFGVGQNPEFPGYAVRGPGTYQVTLKLSGKDEVAVQSPPFAMAAGQVFSVVLAETGGSALELRVVREK